MTYYWDETVSRYRDELGRFVSKSTVVDFVNHSIAASTNVADTLSQFVSNGLMSVDDWRSSFRQEIKDEYIRQYLTYRGGLEQMTKADWGSIGGMLGEQYKYLDGFMDEVAAGTLTEAQIEARSAMYINSAREAGERAKRISAKNAGYDLVDWVVNGALENCDDCLDFQAMGSQEVDKNPFGGAYPGSGNTRCLTNCGCGLEYSNSKTDDEYAY